MSKILIIILSTNDSEIKKSNYPRRIKELFKNDKLEKIICNNALIIYRNAEEGNNIISDNEKMMQIKECINSYDEVIILYHSLDDDDLKKLKGQLGHDEKCKNIDIYSSQSEKTLFNIIVELLEFLCDNKSVNDIFDAIWSKSIKKNDENLAYSYRYETFLSFVFLHLSVQLQHRLQLKEKSATIFCNKITHDGDKESDAANECCTKGINFLNKNGVELNKIFGELVKSIYTDKVKVKVTPKTKNDIEEFVRLYGKVLRYTFLELTGNKKTLGNTIYDRELTPYTFLGLTGKIKSITWPRNINPFLTDVEKLFNIIDNGVASYREVIKQVCSIRHELGDNAITRLNLFRTTQLPEQLKSLKMELEDLKTKFNKFAGQNVDEYFQIDFKEELDKASKVIHEMQEEISTGLDDIKILKMRGNLVCLLQKFIEKTLIIAPRDRK